METKDSKPLNDPNGPVVTSQERRKARRSKKESGPHEKGKVDGKGNGTVERLPLHGADGSLREYFTNHKPLLLVMDFHSLVLTKKRGSEKVFKCTSCDLVLKSLEEVDIHIQRSRHISRLRASWCHYAVSKIYPSEPILKKLNDFLEEVVTSSAADEQVLSSRKKAYNEISSFITKVSRKFTLHMVGSSFHGLGLRDCDLNISLSCDDDSPIALSIAALSTHLESNKAYQGFERNFNEEKKPPCMRFIYKGKLHCNIMILDNHSHQLAKLLKEYRKIDDRCRKLCVLFRKWAMLCCIDGTNEGCWPSHAIYLLVIYFLQQLKVPVLPVLHELIPSASGEFEVYEGISDILNMQWVTKNTLNLASLWLQLLRFYTHEFDAANHLVCITQLQPKQRSKAGTFWSGKRIAIVDPYFPDKNITKTVSNSTIYDFIMHCLRTTYVYFSIPQCAEGPIFGSLRPRPLHDRNLNIPGYEEFLDVQLRLSHYIVRLIPHTDSNYLVDYESDVMTICEKIASIKGLYINICSFNFDDFNNLKKPCKPRRNKYIDYCLFPEDAQYLINRINIEEVKYQFNYSSFAGGEEHPKCCVICSMNGHTQSTCPELVLEKMKEMPVIDEELTKLIDTVCYEVYNDSKPSTSDLMMKEKTMKFLQNYIATLFPDATLTLFGSSRNGFGLKNSDMDICMTFRDCPSGVAVPPGALHALFRHLKSCSLLKKLIHIQSAKVPIIKFLHLPSMLEGDISLYNLLAQENTKLLRTYAEIDERVKILGYMVKQFAKVCNIGDASKGSLSSYCYILMMIYFLQRCSPPVIPVLQALPVSPEPLPQRFVDNYNTYFFDDVSNLRNIWPDYKRNSKSPGQLWIEFLRFYTEEFDSENYVVSIRSPQMVLKLEKQWFTKIFAIEDPFNHAHNLGSGLTRKMNLYIIRAFRSARSIFTSKLKTTGKQSLADAYFNKKILSKTEPPAGRGCKICKCIGHRARACPQRNSMSSQQKKTEIENNPPNDSAAEKNKKKSRGKEQGALNERFAEGNRMLFSSSSKPSSANPGSSKGSGFTQSRPTMPLLQPKQLYPLPPPPGEQRVTYSAPPNSARTRQAQQDSYKQVMEALLKNKSNIDKKTHK